MGVDELRSSNPFFKRLFGRDSAEKTISATAEVIETVGTIGSTRRMVRSDAAVAEGTVEDRLADSGLDVDMKRLQVEREREALFRDRIENARAVESLNAERVQRRLIEAALREGRVRLADALGELGDDDALALGGLVVRELEVVQREADESEGPYARLASYLPRESLGGTGGPTRSPSQRTSCPSCGSYDAKDHVRPP